MKKVIVMLMFFLITGLSLFADDTGTETNMRMPVMSMYYPHKHANAMLIKAPPELVQFFESKGIDPHYLSEDCCEIPYEVRVQMWSICSECRDDFCNAVESVIAPYKNINKDVYYDAIVLQMGNVYWTVWT